MNPEAIVQLIIQKGLKNVNLSMFSQVQKNAVLQEVVEIYLRQGKTSEVLEILEHVDLKRFADMVRPLAEECIEVGDYKRAALIYEKIGDHELAEFIRENFIEK